jgi:hypothetical protein
MQAFYRIVRLRQLVEVAGVVEVVDVKKSPTTVIKAVASALVTALVRNVVKTVVGTVIKMLLG